MRGLASQTFVQVVGVSQASQISIGFCTLHTSICLNSAFIFIQQIRSTTLSTAIHYIVVDAIVYGCDVFASVHLSRRVLFRRTTPTTYQISTTIALSALEILPIPHQTRSAYFVLVLTSDSIVIIVNGEFVFFATSILLISTIGNNFVVSIALWALISISIEFFPFTVSNGIVLTNTIVVCVLSGSAASALSSGIFHEVEAVLAYFTAVDGCLGFFTVGEYGNSGVRSGQTISSCVSKVVLTALIGY